MDPKQSTAPSGQLDPKLKEAYERVMGLAPNTSVQKTPATAQPAPTPIQSGPTTPAAPPPPQPVAAPPQPVQTQSTVSSMPTMQTATAPEKDVDGNITTPGQAKTEPLHVTTSVHGFVAGKQKKSGGLSPVVIVLAAIVFIVVYTLVWVKIFNVQLPFLP